MGVWHVIGRVKEVGEFSLSPLANRLHKFITGKRAEERKRTCLAVLFAHKEQGQMGRKEHEARGKPLLGRRFQNHPKSVSFSAVAHLIVILNADDESIAA